MLLGTVAFCASAAFSSVGMCSDNDQSSGEGSFYSQAISDAKQNYLEDLGRGVVETVTHSGPAGNAIDVISTVGRNAEPIGLVRDLYGRNDPAAIDRFNAAAENPNSGATAAQLGQMIQRHDKAGGPNTRPR